MMDLGSIRALQNEVTAEAAQQAMAPVVIFSHDTVEDDLRNSPQLGLYCHPDWRPADPADYADDLLPYERGVEDRDGALWLFCDAFGFGSEFEPALLFSEVCDLFHALLDSAISRDVTLGVGIVEEGEFQLYLGVFEKER